MVPKEMPTKLLVIGSGAIGVEFASFYSDMGAEVTIVEMLPRILPVEDEEVSAFVHKALAKQGMKIHVGSGVDKLEAAQDRREGDDQGRRGDAGILATPSSPSASSPNSEGIGLEALGVKTDRGHIVTDGYGRTNVEGIYAIGDVTGPPWLAHKASHEGVVCVEAIAGKKPHPFETWNIPGCTYSRPQVASVGLTEAKAKEAGHKVKVGKFPFIGNGKAIALGEAEGFVKTVFDAETGRTAGRPYGRRRGHRADPGLCRRAAARDHRGRADGDGLPASDAERDDARERARRLRAGAAYVRPGASRPLFHPKHQRTKGHRAAPVR